jgi:hypothetical protein
MAAKPVARRKRAAKKRTSRKKKTVRAKKATPKRTVARRRPRQAMVVTISGERPIHEVANDLKAKGFEVGQVLDSIGSVTGYAHPRTKKQLKGIRGVADVSEDQPVDIGPPGAPVS